jgi:hypothetical protein
VAPEEGCVGVESLDGSSPCNCPTRTAPPPALETCPFEPVAANVQRIKEWIGKYYASSAFYTCTNQKLPLVKQLPPLQLFVDKTAIPVAVRQPGTIPLHLQKEVKEELDRDIRIGVIEQVPVNTQDLWCS